MRAARALLALLATVAAIPVAQAQCQLQLGHGWPPATESHGSAVETLLQAGATPALNLTWLPEDDEEAALMLLRPAGDGDWTLRYARADRRVDGRESVDGGFVRVLRTDQTPELVEVPMPATLAQRVRDSWQRVLQAGVPDGRAAAFHPGEVRTFVVDGQRISGPEPDCGAAELMMEQAGDLVDAAGEGDPDDLPERWQDLWESLDELDGELAAAR